MLASAVLLACLDATVAQREVVTITLESISVYDLWLWVQDEPEPEAESYDYGPYYLEPVGDDLDPIEDDGRPH